MGDKIHNLTYKAEKYINVFNLKIYNHIHTQIIFWYESLVKLKQLFGNLIDDLASLDFENIEQEIEKFKLYCMETVKESNIIDMRFFIENLQNTRQTTYDTNDQIYKLIENVIDRLDNIIESITKENPLVNYEKYVLNFNLDDMNQYFEQFAISYTELDVDHNKLLDDKLNIQDKLSDDNVIRYLWHYNNTETIGNLNTSIRDICSNKHESACEKYLQIYNDLKENDTKYKDLVQKFEQWIELIPRY